MLNLTPILLMSLIFPGGEPPPGQEEKAQSTAAILEMNNLITAMEMFYIDNNRFTTLENLDDLAAPNPDQPWQNINDGGGALVFHPNVGELSRQFFPPETYLGPYIAGFQGNRIEGPNGDYDLGTPLDPWGNPYYFYSPLGLIEPSTDSISLRYYGDAFDRYTIISHGPDGIPLTSDDLGLQFGVTITVATISSAVVTTELEKSETPILRIRGYNLGSEGEESAVLASGSPIDGTILQWSSEEILLEATPPVDGTPVSVRLANGTITREVSLVGGEETRVTEWILFD
ncbi:MAG: hypothetical protein JJU11_13530 [Candidatus Sumerlaeia bacterium]|nr:hypothetical protein [Candidatus Sumerlaeia bacterium]